MVSLFALFASSISFLSTSEIDAFEGDLDRCALRALISNFTEAAPYIRQLGIQEFLSIQLALVSEEALELGEFPEFPQHHIVLAEVYADEKISCDIYGLREEGTIVPMHDHRNMFGFIHVVRGKLSIDSFSWLDPVEVTERELHQQSFNHTRAKPVRYEGQRTLSADNHEIHSVHFFGPMKNNVHAITALEKDTVFFRLLIPGYKHRRPRYFILEPEDYFISGRVYWIHETWRKFIYGRWPYPPVSL